MLLFLEFLKFIKIWTVLKKTQNDLDYIKYKKKRLNVGTNGRAWN